MEQALPNLLLRLLLFPPICRETRFHFRSDVMRSSDRYSLLFFYCEFRADGYARSGWSESGGNVKQFNYTRVFSLDGEKAVRKNMIREIATCF